MNWLDYFSLWILFGLIAYTIKYVKYRDDWKKEGNQVFFIGVLIAALIFGPIGLLMTLIRSKGNPFKEK